MKKLTTLTAFLIISFKLLAGELYISVDQNSAMIIGEIDENLAIEVKNLPETIRTIVIDSMGGRVDSAIEISETIRGRSLDTHTKTICYSACTLIFQSGKFRTADPSAHFMYHKVRWYGPGRENLPHFQKLLDDKYIEYGLESQFVYSIPQTDLYLFAEELTGVNAVNLVAERSFEWQQGDSGNFP